MTFFKHRINESTLLQKTDELFPKGEWGRQLLKSYGILM